MTPPPIDQCMLFLSMIELFPETNNDWYRYKLQSSLTPLPSHNKREQYLGNQITRFRNAPWQCGGKKKKLPWRQIAPFPLDLFISPPFSPFFRYNSTFYFLIFFYYYPVLLLNPLLYIQLVLSTQPYVAVGESRTKIFAERTLSPTIGQLSFSACLSNSSRPVLWSETIDTGKAPIKKR